MKEKYGTQTARDMIEFRHLFWSVAGYTPTKKQHEIISASRWTKLISGGVRGGKSITTAMLLVDFLMLPGEIIWLIGGNFEAPREEFTYLMNPLRQLGLVTDNNLSVPRNKSEQWTMEITNGATVQTKSSHDVAAIASVAPIAQAYIEAAQQDPEIFDKAYERGLQKDGLIVFSGTLEASKQLTFTNKMIEWKDRKGTNPIDPEAWSLPTWSNTVQFPGGREDPKFLRLVQNMTPEKFAERIEAVPYKPAGAVHKRFTTANVQPITVDPNLPVHIAVDPGYTSYAVLFLQKHGEYVHVLDEVYRHEALTGDIVDEVMRHPLWEYVEWGIIDKAARQHHANVSVWELWRRMTGIPLVTRSVSIDDGIDAIEIRCLPGEDGSPRLLVSEDMRLHVAPDGRASSLRAEFNLRKYPRYSVGRSAGVKPIKANDHALNALGYYLFHWYRQEQSERAMPGEVGKRPQMAKQFDRYLPPKPNYSGNTSRSRKVMRRGRRLLRQTA